MFIGHIYNLMFKKCIMFIVHSFLFTIYCFCVNCLLFFFIVYYWLLIIDYRSLVVDR